jgi:predicted RNA-binding protein with PUA-like domain
MVGTISLRRRRMRNRSRKAIVDLGIQIIDLKSGFQILNLQSEITMDYLLKTEPSTYSFADLLRDKTTTWDGVSNPVALKNMRAMKAGDRLVIYHTGDEKSAVGTASVVSVDLSDAKNPQVKIKAGKTIAKPVTLAEVKAHKLFADSPLVRQGRLSVVPLTKEQFGFLVED